MAQFQIKNWDDGEHRAAKITAMYKGKTLYAFIVEAVREKVDREGPKAVVAELRKQKAETPKK